MGGFLKIALPALRFTVSRRGEARSDPRFSPFLREVLIGVQTGHDLRFFVLCTHRAFDLEYDGCLHRPRHSRGLRRAELGSFPGSRHHSSPSAGNFPKPRPVSACGQCTLRRRRRPASFQRRPEVEDLASTVASVPLFGPAISVNWARVKLVTAPESPAARRVVPRHRRLPARGSRSPPRPRWRWSLSSP